MNLDLLRTYRRQYLNLRQDLKLEKNHEAGQQKLVEETGDDNVQ
jgi:hypothetical protein